MSKLAFSCFKEGSTKGVEEILGGLINADYDLAWWHRL
jgi:hypothetical protein